MNVLAPPIIITGNTSSFEQATAAGLGKGGVAFGIQPRFKAMDNRHETALLTVGFVCTRLAPWTTYEGSLSGTTSAAFVDGYAEFTDLAINKIGTYTLVYDLVVTAGTGSSQLCANGPLDGTINETDFSVTMGPVASMRLDDPFPQITVTGGALGCSLNSNRIGLACTQSPVSVKFARPPELGISDCPIKGTCRPWESKPTAVTVSSVSITFPP